MNSFQAKQIQIADYLQTLGIKPTKVQGNNYWYRSPYRNEQSASFKVDTAKNIWYDHGTGKGGNILDLIMCMHNIHSIETALTYLSRQSISTKRPVHSSFSSNVMKEQNPVMTIQSIIPITHPKLIEWIRERKIDLSLVNRYCREIYFLIA
jgi:DNA primase